MREDLDELGASDAEGNSEGHPAMKGIQHDQHDLHDLERKKKFQYDSIFFFLMFVVTTNKDDFSKF